MNWLVITIGAIFLISFIVGVYRGAIKICVSLATTIVTLAVVFFMTPYVTKAIREYTPLDETIEQNVVKAMAKYSTNLMLDENSQNVGLTEDSIRQVLNAAGLSEEQLEEHGFSIEDIASGKMSSKDLEGLGISKQVLAGLEEGQATIEDEIKEAEIPKDVQFKVIEGANMPERFKTLLTQNNNQDGYAKLGAETFGQYVAKYLTSIVLNIIAFLGLFILLTIIARAIIFALDVVATLPVLGFINRLAGGVLGAVGALIIVWFIFLLVALAYTAGFAKEIVQMIEANSILAMFYDNNPIMALITRL
ncbi:MAG TPA: CvpA family protein [Candidatus Dorea intestinavium]|nr:CvpA family protein [Candidatus Dorea intestinavium]